MVNGGDEFVSLRIRSQTGGAAPECLNGFGEIKVGNSAVLLKELDASSEFRIRQNVERRFALSIDGVWVGAMLEKQTLLDDAEACRKKMSNATGTRMDFIVGVLKHVQLM